MGWPLGHLLLIQRMHNKKQNNGTHSDEREGIEHGQSQTET
jgi:hypothetical protein